MRGSTRPGDLAANAGTTGTLAVGDESFSQLETGGDRDWFAINLVAGQSYTFTLDGTGSPALSDPLLTLYSATGVMLTSDDDSGTGLNSLITFTATTTGVHYLQAGAYSSSYTGE